MAAPMLDRLQSVNDGVAALAQKELNLLLGSLSGMPPAAIRDAVFEAVPALVQKYGDVGATAAADWFDEFRAHERVPGRFVAAPAPPADAGVVSGRLGFATRPDALLWAGELEDFNKFVAAMVNEYVMQPGHDTVRENAARDRAGWARVPEPGACNFCIMLAGRGFQYSKSTVTSTVSGERFHPFCRCHGVPVWDETKARVEYGFNPEHAEGLYLKAREIAGGDTKAILAEMRKITGNN